MLHLSTCDTSDHSLSHRVLCAYLFCHATALHQAVILINSFSRLLVKVFILLTALCQRGRAYLNGHAQWQQQTIWQRYHKQRCMLFSAEVTPRQSNTHRFLIGVLLLIQLTYELQTPTDSVRGAPLSLGPELPTPLRIPLVIKYIHADAVLQPQQGSCQRSPALSTNIPSACGAMVSSC